jgi:RNA-directed DNA polymerase
VLFRNRLKDRIEDFGLQIAEEKTRSIEFGRFARANARRRGGKPQEFTFLGVYALLWEDPQGKFQDKTPHQS